MASIMTQAYAEELWTEMLRDYYSENPPDTFPSIQWVFAWMLGMRPADD